MEEEKVEEEEELQRTQLHGVSATSRVQQRKLGVEGGKDSGPGHTQGVLWATWALSSSSSVFLQKSHRTPGCSGVSGCRSPTANCSGRACRVSNLWTCW